MTTLDVFAPHVDTVFTVTLKDARTYGLTLFRASPLPSHHYPGKQRDPFELRFRGPDELLFGQEVFPLTHAILGRVDIFMAPIGHEDGHFIYQAVFN